MAKDRRGVVIKIAERPIAFAMAFLLIFALTYAFLYYVDAVPEPVPASEESVSTAGVEENQALPVRLVVPALELDTKVVNPTSQDIAVLDEALKDGAVRFPTSAAMGQDGTMVLFGHSSYLPVIYHQYYKLFDGIQDLKTGDSISVYSGSVEYRYKVVGVKRVSSTNGDNLVVQEGGKHLVLATCDSFTKKENRFVVTADFVGAYSLAN